MQRCSLFIIALSGFAAAFSVMPSVPAAEIILDAGGANAWVQCMQALSPDAEQCAAQSASTPGGKLAELAVPSFSPAPENLPPPPPEGQVSALISAMQAWDISEMMQDVGGLFPPLPGHTAHIYVVGNGKPVMSDMYVRNFADRNGKTEMVDRGGTPVVLIDARQVAQYSKDPRVAATLARGVVRHEIFHMYYAWYRAGDPRWQKVLRSPLTKEEDLLLSVQDEGIAHFLASQKWAENGFPADHGAAAMAALSRVISALHAGTLTNARLQQANEGSFWDKYASVSGAMFATGIYRTFGRAGLARSLRDGPAAFLLRYDAATKKNKDLLPLDPVLLRWARHWQHWL